MGSNSIFHSNNNEKRKMRIEDSLVAISNLPKSKFEEIVLGYIIYFDTKLYYDNLEQFNAELFTGINVEVFTKFLEFVNAIGRNIDKISLTDFLKTFNDNEKDISKVSENIFNETTLNLAETSLVPDVSTFLNYLSDLEYNVRERKAFVEAMVYVNLLADSKRKSKSLQKKELILSEQLDKMQQTIYTKNDKYPILCNSAIQEVSNDLYDPLKAFKPIPTQFLDLEKTGKIFPCQLIVIAGRPAMGKTSFALCLYDYFLRQGVNSIFFSCEMNKEQITMKLMNLVFNENVSEYIDKDGVLVLPENLKSKWSDTLKNEYKTISLVDKPVLSISEIKKYVIQRNYNGRVLAEKEYRENNKDKDIVLIPDYIKEKNNIKVIFIDYLQILQESENPMKGKAEKIGDITTSLKRFGLENKVTIILISQLNRDGESEIDKRPNMSQLKGSGSIEQDADKVLLMYRDEYYNEKKLKVPAELKEDIKGVAELIVDKQRGGTTGTIYLDWDGVSQKFSNMTSKTLKTGSFDENDQDILRTVLSDERIDLYKKATIEIEEINRGRGNSYQEQQNNAVWADKLKSVMSKSNTANTATGVKTPW